jgi:aryl-alcohol dehydrogenase-like predicted oxidoreductase
MKFKTLGRTGLQVSVLGLGTAQLGHVYGRIDEAEGERTVRVALDLGINYIDASPYYGCAETVLGRALRDVSRDRYLLATKAGRYGVDAFDFSAARIRSSLEASLQTLGVDTIDVFQLHDIEFCRLDRIVEESVPTMRSLVTEGKIRFWGITGHPLATLRSVAARTDPDTVLSYCHHTLNDDSLLEVLPEFSARGIGVINASPTGMGLLTHGELQGWHPADSRIREICARAVAWCAQRDVDITKLALQFAARHPDIATTLVGTAFASEITENVQWVEAPLEADLIASVREILAPIRNATWPVGRPENS